MPLLSDSLPRRSHLTLLWVSVFVLFLHSCSATKPVPRTELSTPSQNVATISGTANLARVIDAVLQDSALVTTSAGIRVVRVRDGAVLYERDSRKLFHPASNMKLLVAAGALHYLGPQYRFRTRVYTDSTAVLADSLRGNLYLRGSGYPDFALGDLMELVATLRARGVRFVDGDVICDDTFLDDVPFGNGWMWDEGSSDLFAPVSALTVHDNSVQVFVRPAQQPGSPVRVWTIPETDYVQILNQAVTVASPDSEAAADSLLSAEPLHIERQWQTGSNVIEVRGTLPTGSAEVEEWINISEPALFFGTLFMEQCRRMGIGIRGELRRGVTPAGAQLLAEHVSPPLPAILINMNKPSDNLSAELLLKTIGAEVFGVPGSADKGLTAVKSLLARWGIDTTGIHLADGSGVSRYNLLSPYVLSQLLVNMYRDFGVRSEFIASLPIGGIDGTLSRRMRNTAAMGIVHAKTGSLAGVSTLSGYTLSQDGEVLAFSIMMSHFVGSSAVYRMLQDRIVDAITRYSQSPESD